MFNDSSASNENKTPILLHPRKRAELLEKGMALFNNELFFEAHEEWERLWLLEQGRDRLFIQGLIQVAGHLVHVQKGQWSGAMGLLKLAREKLLAPIGVSNPHYKALDIEPLLAALDYNEELLLKVNPTTPPPVAGAFLVPKLFLHHAGDF